MCSGLINLCKSYCSQSVLELLTLKRGLDSRRRFITSAKMANSKWDYVKSFESEEKLLPNCWAIARIDGKGFHKLSKRHNWRRPNDERALKLMSKAAKLVMGDYNDIVMAYGQSDEYSFVFRRDADIYQRRATKIITTLVAKFAASYVYNWKEFFPDEELQYPPSFDGRMVLYPTDQNLRDYLSWRQADCHINNLYNTTFWALVLKGGLSNNDATKQLSGTLSGDKNEILFSRFNINYNNEPELYRKGTVLVQPLKNLELKSKRHYSKQKLKQLKRQEKKQQESQTVQDANDENVKHEVIEDESILELNCDIIGNSFWEEYPYLLSPQEFKRNNAEDKDSDSKSVSDPAKEDLKIS